MKPYGIAIASALLSFGATQLPQQAAADTAYGVISGSGGQSLVTWDLANPATLLTNVPITGLAAGDTIRTIDFTSTSSPSQQRLFGVGVGSGSLATLYVIDRLSGVASLLPHSMSPRASAYGEFFGGDLSPTNIFQTIDDETYQTEFNTSQNYGTVTGASSYFPGDVNAAATPRVVHYAYGGAPDGLYYGIDTGLDVLVRVDESTNRFETLFSLGMDFDDAGGMDTYRPTGAIYAALQPAGQTTSNFYTISRATGAPTLIGGIGGGVLIDAMAIHHIPEPTSALLLGTCCAGMLAMRRHSARKFLS